MDMDITIDTGIEWMIIITLLWDTSMLLIHDQKQTNQLKWDEKCNYVLYNTQLHKCNSNDDKYVLNSI